MSGPGLQEGGSQASCMSHLRQLRLVLGQPQKGQPQSQLGTCRRRRRNVFRSFIFLFFLSFSRCKATAMTREALPSTPWLILHRGPSELRRGSDCPLQGPVHLPYLCKGSVLERRRGTLLTCNCFWPNVHGLENCGCSIADQYCFCFISPTR